MWFSSDPPPPLPSDCIGTTTDKPIVDYNKCCDALSGEFTSGKVDCSKWTAAEALIKTKLGFAVDSLTAIKSAECAANKSCGTNTSFFNDTIQQFCTHSEEKYKLWMIIVPAVVALLAIIFAFMK